MVLFQIGAGKLGKNTPGAPCAPATDGRAPGAGGAETRTQPGVPHSAVEKIGHEPNMENVANYA